MQKTIQILLERASKKIPVLDAEILLVHVLGTRREHVLAHGEAVVAWRHAALYRLLVFRRQRGVPLAYLTGEKEFFGLNFFVNRHVLIPRPETELMVELVLDRLQQSDFSNQPKSEVRRLKTVLIDVGTGSGCIPIAIMKHGAWNTEQTVRAIAIDSSQKALDVTKRNANRHGADITFLQGNLLEPLFKERETWNMEQIILTANLPYLTPEQYAEEPSIQHEPKSALVSGPTGLELYEHLLQQLSAFGCQLSAFFEIDPSQSEAMRRLIKKYLSGALVEIKKDLCGRERVVTLFWKNRFDQSLQSK